MSQHDMASFPDSAFGRNAYERKVVVDYAASEGLSPSDIFTHCLTEVDATRWPAPTLSAAATAAGHMVGGHMAGGRLVPPTMNPAAAGGGGQLPLPLSNYECCGRCAEDAFSQLLYKYRQAIPAGDLPDAVTRRPNCWYGKECRTQSHNHAHAEQKNHICDNTRGAGPAGGGGGGARPGGS